MRFGSAFPRGDIFQLSFCLRRYGNCSRETKIPRGGMMKTALHWFLALQTLTPVFANAAPFGMVYTRDYLNEHARWSSESPNSGGSTRSRKKLLYHGGPVIPAAKVYAVMWGPSVDADTQSGIGPMLSATLNSTYFDMFQEYDTTTDAVDGRAGTQQQIGRGTLGGTVVIQPANTKLDITDDEIGAGARAPNRYRSSQ